MVCIYSMYTNASRSNLFPNQCIDIGLIIFLDDHDDGGGGDDDDNDE